MFMYTLTLRGGLFTLNWLPSCHHNGETNSLFVYLLLLATQTQRQAEEERSDSKLCKII